MIKEGVRVWTKRGWQYHEDLFVGDTVMSFNPYRGYCEYDTIQEVKQEYTFLKQMYGIKSKNIRMWYTPDHPLMLFSDKTRQTKFIPIEESFMRTGNFIIARPFEPFNESSNNEDIKWSARYSAMFSRARYLPDMKNIKSIVEELSGFEAQDWLEEFYRWNILIQGVNWMKSSLLRNKDIRDLIFHIAPRAGVGSCWWPLIRSKMRAMRITTIADAHLGAMNYGLKDYQGYLFDIKTSNKNYLVQYRQSTFLVASGLG